MTAVGEVVPLVRRVALRQSHAAAYLEAISTLVNRYEESPREIAAQISAAAINLYAEAVGSPDDAGIYLARITAALAAMGHDEHPEPEPAA